MINKDAIFGAIVQLDEFSKHYEENILTNKDEIFLQPQAVLYSYGCPRIGNRAFNALLHKQVKTHYKVELNGDIVTILPPYFSFTAGLYSSSAGIQVVIDSDEAGNLIVKPNLIEQVLLSKNNASIGNHDLNLYRICIEKCFDKAELKEYLEKEKLFSFI